MRKYLCESDVIHDVGNADSTDGMSEFESRIFDNICKAVSELTAFTYVYAVTAQTEYGLPKLSGECYRSLEEAQKFVESRGDKPKKVTDFKYSSARWEYQIHEMQIC